MSSVKERIIGALSMLGDTEAEKIWVFMLNEFSPRSWEEIPEDKPAEDEIAILEAYKNGDPEYQPLISQDELLKELGIQL